MAETRPASKEWSRIVVQQDPSHRLRVTAGSPADSKTIRVVRELRTDDGTVSGTSWTAIQTICASPEDARALAGALRDAANEADKEAAIGLLRRLRLLEAPIELNAADERIADRLSREHLVLRDYTGPHVRWMLSVAGLRWLEETLAEAPSASTGEVSA